MTPGLHRIRRARSSMLFWMVGILPALVGLAAVGLEDVSFGHEHVIGGKTVYHHHFHLGAHEHQGAQPGDDHDDDHDGDHDGDHDHHDHPDHPVPHHHDAPRRAATVAAAPALFQPLDVSTLVLAPAASTPVVLAGLPSPVLGSFVRTADSRGPPFPACCS
jgi:hypothetical protein